MTELSSSERSGVGLGLPLILALVFANLARTPNTAQRPTPDRVESVPVAASETVPARLWRDPLEAAYAHVRALAAGASDLPPELRPRRAVGAWRLAREVQERVRDGQDVTVMPVLVPGGNRAENHELRLRARYAVVSALTHDAADYVPQFDAVDPEHIGLARFPLGSLRGARAARAPREAGAEQDEPEASAVYVPFEWFEHLHEGSASGPRSVVVLWINERSIQGHALFLLADLVHELRLGARTEPLTLADDTWVARPAVALWRASERAVGDPGARAASSARAHEPGTLDVAILGPSNSDTLLEMIADDRSWNRRRWDGAAARDALRGARMISPRSTLHRPPGEEGSLDDPGHEWFGEDRSGVRFERTIGTDRELASLLLDELRRRSPDRFPGDLGFPFGFLRRWLESVKFLHRPPGPLRIALLSEVDTSYGRAWQRLLREVAAYECSSAGAYDSVPPPDEGAEFYIESKLHYMRGIDGRIPGRESDDTQEAGKEPAAGEGQLDYLRRLERALANARYDAIGILGNDVYDKAALLHVLRPRFPRALFFTTDVDARLLPRISSPHSLNLLVASHYGLNLRDDLDLELPPLRGSYQAATFLAARLALEPAPERGDPWRYDPEPHVYEVGRTWIHQLSSHRPVPGFTLAHGDRTFDPNPARDDISKSWLFRDQHQQGVLVAAVLVALVLVVSYSWRLRLGAVNRAGTGLLTRRRLRELGRSALDMDSHPCLYLVGTSVVLLLSAGLVELYVFMRDSAEVGEPFFVVEGISSWPTIWLRIATILVAVLGYFRTWSSVLRLRKGLAGGLLPTAYRPDGGPVERAWARFRRMTRWRNVTLASLGMALVYYRLAGWMFQYLGGDVVPVRGESTYVIERFVLWWSVVLFVALVFVVLWVTLAAIRFILALRDADPEDWPFAKLNAFAREHGLETTPAADLLRVRVVQAVGGCVGPCVWWPATVLFLMVLSRANLFDRWSWPVSLVLILALSFLLLLLSGHGVRVAARDLRDRSLEALAAQRLRILGERGDSGPIDAVVAEIRGLRVGVFAPLWEHPLLRAWLLPIAALGANTSMEAWLPRLLSDF